MSLPSLGYTIGGASTSTTAPLPVANTIDAVNDYFPIYTNSLTATQAINRNTFLGISGSPVGTTDSQTLTNKVLTSPTISGPTLSGTLTGTYTIGGTPTFPSSIVTLTGSQTLTNKTLTSPTINSPTITNAILTTDAVTGFTTSNNGTVFGISVSGGQITNAAIANNTIGTAQIATNGVSASNLATNAITLGYAQITSDQTSTSGGGSQVTGLTTTVTIPSGGRKVKITAYCGHLFNTTAGDQAIMQIWDGTVGSGTQLTQAEITVAYNNLGVSATAIAVVTPAPGSKTYNVGLSNASGGTATLSATATMPAFILVETI